MECPEARSDLTSAGGSIIGSRPSKPTLVLLTEDNFVVRAGIADMLAEAGFRVIAAADADEALSVLGARPDVQVLMSDVVMPGRMDGCALAQVVRERWPSVGIVISSGKGRPPEDRIPGGVLFLAKPFTTKQLLNALRAVLPEDGRKRQIGAAGESGASGLPTDTGLITDPGIGGEMAQPVASPEKD